MAKITLKNSNHLLQSWDEVRIGEAVCASNNTHIYIKCVNNECFGLSEMKIYIGEPGLAGTMYRTVIIDEISAHID